MNAKINIIAISVSSDYFTISDIVSPCGACRQVMAEYEDKQCKNIKIILHSPDDQVLIAHTVKDLLPFMFKLPHLKKH